MKYAIKLNNPDSYELDAVYNQYMTDDFGEVLVFDNLVVARAYAEKHIDECITLQIVEV